MGLERITDDHVKAVCRPGEGADCCRYLTAGALGWSCAKFSNLAGYLNKRVALDDFTARGDNCEGRTNE